MRVFVTLFPPAERRAFARIGTYAYVAGWSARGIFSLLSAADFEQAGGLLPVASPALTT